VAESDAETLADATTREGSGVNERNPACCNASGGSAIIPRRERNKAHLKIVASQTCLVCSGKPSDPHHLRFAQARALDRKVSDEYTVPFCRSHHRDVHRSGNEVVWWKNARMTRSRPHSWSKTRAGASPAQQAGTIKPLFKTTETQSKRRGAPETENSN
jgi:hypothetical protein